MGIGQVNRITKSAIFLDRDGVLNHAIIRDGKPYPPKDLSEFRIVECAREQLVRLKAMGFVLFIVTNQPDIARGTQTLTRLEEINQRLRQELPIDDIFTCPHDNKDKCECRKPAPGLLQKAATRYGIDLQNSFLIGDRWRDIDAGHAAGCTTVMIDYGYDEQGPAKEPALRVSTLAEAVSFIEKRKAEQTVANYDNLN